MTPTDPCIRVKAREEILNEGFSLTRHQGTVQKCGLSTSPLYLPKLRRHKDHFIWDSLETDQTFPAFSMSGYSTQQSLSFWWFKVLLNIHYYGTGNSSASLGPDAQTCWLEALTHLPLLMFSSGKPGGPNGVPTMIDVLRGCCIHPYIQRPGGEHKCVKCVWLLRN